MSNLVSYQQKGKIKYRKATEAELIAMQPEPITWHYDECPLRITFTDEVKHSWLLKYQEHQLIGTYPDICQLMELVKSMTDKRVYHNGETHIYLEELYDEHKAIILAYGATVEYKP